MQPLIDLYKNSDNLHHAYFFVEHRIDKFLLDLKHFFENVVGIKTEGNPDYWHGVFGTLNVDDARAITESSERKDFAGGRKIFVIQADFITEQAQNALLKVFEEPTPGTHFFIISPQDMLLPTLRSRLVIFSNNNSADENNSVLKMSLDKRLEKVKEIVDAISDEEITKQDAIKFLNSIQSELYRGGVENNAKRLELCEKARASLYDNGAPVKMILENLLLSI